MVQNESLQEKWNDCFELKKNNRLVSAGVASVWDRWETVGH